MASVSEDVPVNRVIVRVGATDADVGVSAWIQYSLLGQDSEDFSIDPDTGTQLLSCLCLCVRLSVFSVCVVLNLSFKLSVQVR